MVCEIISVGSELLLGDIVNTNAAFLAKNLAAAGVFSYWQTTIGDNRDRLVKATRQAMARCDLVVLSGGLGPTGDDITLAAVAEALCLPLETDEAVLKTIEEYFARQGRVMTENNKKQALVLPGAKIIPNDNGTAPGLMIQKDGKTAILLPGPPAELEPMFVKYVLPYLQRISGQVLVSKTVHLFGIGEAAAEEKLVDLMQSTNPTLAPYAKYGEVQLRITAAGRDLVEAEALTQPMLAAVRERVGEHVYGVDIKSLENAVVAALTEKGLCAAVAESITGGGIARRMTAVAGASAVFAGGFCTYSDRMKTALLGVDENLLKKHGAVSGEVAQSMAKGALEKTGADIALSSTGIAGPGAVEGKPVGLVYIAVHSAWYSKTVTLNLPGTGEDGREKIRHLSENHGLHLLLQAVREYKKPEG